MPEQNQLILINLVGVDLGGRRIIKKKNVIVQDIEE